MNTSQWAGIKLTTLVVIGTDCIYKCKSHLYNLGYDGKITSVFTNKIMNQIFISH